MNRRISFSIALSILVLGLVSCGGQKSQPAQSETPAEAEPVAPVQEEEAAPAEPVTEAEPSIDQEITVDAIGNTMADMGYSVSEIKAEAYSTIKLTLNNTATEAGMVHNIVITPSDAVDAIATDGLKAGPDKQYVPEDDRIIAYTAMANPGEVVSVTFETPGPGEYTFVCTYPGHSTMMRGSFIVE